MERGDKILKNGIFAISTGQKLTEILQVNFFYFSAIYAKNVQSGRGRLRIFAVGIGLMSFLQFLLFDLLKQFTRTTLCT